ncbi:MAG TPA: hypothetical protein VLE50_03095, partial [Cellvibrio sp.]|nr:hypothetical protein [Cellvibrio sp.]
SLSTTLFLAITAGLFFGIGIALCLEWLDQRIRHISDLERGLGLTVLASIPSMASRATISKESRR